MNESFVTVVGNLTGDPVLRHTSSGGRPFVTVRVASTPRRWDRVAGQYVDGSTNYVNVVAFNALAANIAGSFAKGQRVIVYGRLRVNQYVNRDNLSVTSVEVEAYNAGHDLCWGRSTFVKGVRAQFDQNDRMSESDVQDAFYGSENDPGEGPQAAGPDADVPDQAFGDAERDAYVVARAS